MSSSIGMRSKEVRDKIKALQKEIRKHEDAVSDLHEKIDELEVGESPIQPDAIVTWESGRDKNGPRLRRGQVISISKSSYHGFEYRVLILSAANKPIGFASINSDHCPLLEDSKKSKK